MSLTLGIDFASFIYRRLNPIPKNAVTEKFTISVIVPAHNEGKNIAAVIAAIYAQTVKPKNVFIVNDNSTDDTDEKCLNLYHQHDNLFYTKMLQNQGKAVSINYIVKKYQAVLGDIIYINDGDLMPDPQCLEELVKGFYNDNVAAVTGFPTLIASGSFLSKQLTYGKEWQIKILAFRKIGQAARNGMYVLCGAVTGYRKNVLLAYPIPTRTQTEDLDYTWVLLEKGYNLGFQEKATCVSYDVSGLKNHWKQTRRWHLGAWQTTYSNLGKFNNAKGLFYTTLIPFWIEAFLFMSKIALIPIIYHYSPYLLLGLLVVEVLVNVGMTLFKKPSYLKYLPAAILYAGVCLASYSASAVQTTFEKLKHREYTWNNRWNKNSEKIQRNKNPKAKFCLSIVTAALLGLVIVYVANVAIPVSIMRFANLKQAQSSVQKIDKIENSNVVLESAGISEINPALSTVAPKNITNLFAKTPKLIDLPYKVNSLEKLLPTKSSKSPNNFSAEEIRLLARLVPIKSLIEKYAPLYGVDPVWYTRILIAESALNPTSYNEISKDYGIAQIKQERYALAKKLALDEKSRYFSARAFVDNIYNPETNLIFGLSLVRMNIDDNALKNTDYDLLSVMYNLGYSGIDKEGHFKPSANTYLAYINSKKTITNEIISAFIYANTPEKITDPRIKAIFTIYSKKYSTEKAYNELLSFYLEEIQKSYKIDPWWQATALDEAGIYANIMQVSYGYNEKANLKTIIAATKKAQTDPKTELGAYLSEIYKRNVGFAK